MDAGFKTVEDLRRASGEELMAIKGVGQKTVEKILASLKGGKTE